METVCNKCSAVLTENTDTLNLRTERAGQVLSLYGDLCEKCYDSLIITLKEYGVLDFSWTPEKEKDLSADMD